jgi:hypothetical protein
MILGGWMDVKATLRISYRNQTCFKVSGWMGCWAGVKPFLKEPLNAVQNYLYQNYLTFSLNSFVYKYWTKSGFSQMHFFKRFLIWKFLQFFAYSNQKHKFCDLCFTPAKIPPQTVEQTLSCLIKPKKQNRSGFSFLSLAKFF